MDDRQVVRLQGPVSDATIEELRAAYRQARLHGPIEKALADPTLAICLRNIVAANQADPHRWYDLSTDGETVYIANVRRPRLLKRPTIIDYKRRASGDKE